MVDEVIPLIKEAIEKRKGNKERIKRRDVLRLALARIFHYMAENGIFALRSVRDIDSCCVCWEDFCFLYCAALDVTVGIYGCVNYCYNLVTSGAHIS
jgi:hypothetical protein